MPAFLAPPTRTIYLTHSKYNGVQPGFRGDYKCCGSIVGVCNKMERRPSAFTPTLESLAVWLGMSLRKLIARETAKAHLCDCTYFFPRFTPSPAGYWFSFALNQYPERIGLP